MRKSLLTAALVAACHPALAAQFKPPGGGLDPTTTVQPAIATTPRTLAARFSDSLNVRDYGAACDGDTDDHVPIQDTLDLATGNIAGSTTLTLGQKASALFSSLTGIGPSVGGGHIVMPMGACYSSVGLTATIPSGQSLSIDGAGPGVLRLIDDGGLSVTMSDAAYQAQDRSYFSLRGMEIRHSTSTRSGTGLSVVSSAFGNHVNLQDVTVDGYLGTDAGSFQDGILLNGVAARVDNTYTYLPNVSAGGTLATDGAGLHITGTVQTSPFNIYSVDARISNSKFAGGYDGLLVDGAVQGVFGDNVQAIGNGVGYDWEGNQTTDGAELLELTNFHANSAYADVKAVGVGGVVLNGGYYFRLSPNTVAWKALDIEHSSEVTVIGSNGSGLGTGGLQDDFLYCIACQQVTESDNNMTSLSGAMGDFSDPGNGLVTAIGNRISSHTDVLKPMWLRSPNPPQPSAYQFWGNSASDEPEGEDDDGSTIWFGRKVSDTYGYLVLGGTNNPLQDWQLGGEPAGSVNYNYRSTLNPAVGAISGTLDGELDHYGADTKYYTQLDVPQGRFTVGGVNVAVQDMRLAGSKAPNSDCRWAVQAGPLTTVPTTDYQAQMLLSCAQGLVSTGPVTDQSGQAVPGAQTPSVIMADADGSVDIMCGGSTTTIPSETIRLPQHPIDKKTVVVDGTCSATSLSFTTLAATTGGTAPVVLGAPTSFAPGSPIKLKFIAANAVWFPTL